ncbi:hypothetical protein [Xenorhabdus thailandensis]|uniref:hypothetical protein n=1 Tax=Xenorhabdus thailandensis TaxID=3136255 RepID=UPI0030F3B641
MNASIKFVQTPETFQGLPATKIQFYLYDATMQLPNKDLIFECSLGSFVVNGQDTGQKKWSGRTGQFGEASVLIVSPAERGNGQLTVSFKKDGKQVGVQPYHFKATVIYKLNFNIITDYAIADGIQCNDVTATLSGINPNNRQLNLHVDGSASFARDQILQTMSVNTDPSGHIHFKLYNINKKGETVTLKGFLEGNKTTHDITHIHFQLNA